MSIFDGMTSSPGGNTDPHRACLPPRDQPGSHHLYGCALWREPAGAEQLLADAEKEADREAEMAADEARARYWQERR